MALDISYIQHSEYLEVTITGTYDMTDAILSFQSTLSYCHMAGYNKVLIDYSGVGPLGGVENTVYSIGIEKLYQKHISSGGPEIQFAYLTDTISCYEPGYDVVVAGPMHVKLFDDRKNALKWLKLEPSS